LAGNLQPERMILLVQKEVAERIVSRGGKESILSLSVRAYGTSKYIMKVHKRFFTPIPKVDSAIIAITNISRNNFTGYAEEKNFFDIVRAGFAHKRKILGKNLKNFEKKPGQLNNIFEKLKINPMARAEDIKFEIWLGISRHLSTDI
jgi:16S rRNA (adenine1518-N6/adenine1519-N6)-dimethyltransferase